MSNPKHILLVENHAGFLRTIRKFLTLKGYHVIPAATGLSALKRLEEKKGRFDLMITELIMPDISGFGLISIAKKKYPLISVVAITGRGDVFEQLAKEYRADVVLKKPLELAKFERVLKGLFRC
jgi:DNA-binding response OmpR family regulator